MRCRIGDCASFTTGEVQRRIHVQWKRNPAAESARAHRKTFVSGWHLQIEINITSMKSDDMKVSAMKLTFLSFELSFSQRRAAATVNGRVSASTKSWSVYFVNRKCLIFSVDTFDEIVS